MIVIYILFWLSVTLSTLISLATIIAMIGKALGFAFDDDWKVYKARKIGSCPPIKVEVGELY